MTVKVLGVRLGDIFLLETMPRLMKEYGWELCYCIDIPFYKKEVIRQFPNCYFHSVYDAVRGVPHPSFVNLPPNSIGDELRKAWPEFESMTIKMIDRMDLWSTFNYRELCNIFRGMVKYWSGILDLLQPDLVLLTYTPHTACDYVLYFLANLRGIGVLLFHGTSIPGYVYTLNRVEDDTPILSRYKHIIANDGASSIDEDDSLPASLEKHVRKLSGLYSDAIPQALIKQPARSTWKNNLSEMAKIRYVQHYPRYLSHVLNQQQYFYYKQKYKSYETSHMNPLEYGLYRCGAWLKRQQLWHEYHQRAMTPDLDVPFVYVPLHYQPECSTVPEGGVFSDQRDVIDVLSNAIPDGWYLYVKEHPGQFLSNFHGDLGRDLSFYSNLASYPNVRLVPVSYDPFRLIDAAKAVATITGTAGWEAIVRGTPALIFGHAWYRGCEGVFYVPSHELCKRAIELIRYGYRLDKHRFRLWLRAMEETCVKACLDSLDMPDSGYSKEENAENLSQAIADTYAGLNRRHA